MSSKPTGIFQVVPPNLSDGGQVQLQIDQFGRLITTGGSGTPGAVGGNVQTVQRPEDGAALTRATVTMTGASAALVTANANRTIVLVDNTASGNSSAVVDPTGGVAAADTGITVAAGQLLRIVGKPAQAAMTQIGTATQKLTVYTG